MLLMRPMMLLAVLMTMEIGVTGDIDLGSLSVKSLKRLFADNRIDCEPPWRWASLHAVVGP